MLPFTTNEKSLPACHTLSPLNTTKAPGATLMLTVSGFLDGFSCNSEWINTIYVILVYRLHTNLQEALSIKPNNSVYLTPCYSQFELHTLSDLVE